MGTCFGLSTGVVAFAVMEMLAGQAIVAMDVSRSLHRSGGEFRRRDKPGWEMDWSWIWSQCFQGRIGFDLLNHAEL